MRFNLIKMNLFQIDTASIEESDLIHEQLVKFNVPKIPFQPDEPFF